VSSHSQRSDEENIAIMHAFVDLLDFKNVGFVDALRMFLQTFRLPGEAQKIDRFMLKFAERYIDGNPGTYFVNAGALFRSFSGDQSHDSCQMLLMCSPML
jgi:Sec7-like guanine-nucleotide exchange factor